MGWREKWNYEVGATKLMEAWRAGGASAERREGWQREKRKKAYLKTVQ
jgi:hypothetical protein